MFFLFVLVVGVLSLASSRSGVVVVSQVLVWSLGGVQGRMDIPGCLWLWSGMYRPRPRHVFLRPIKIAKAASL